MLLLEALASLEEKAASEREVRLESIRRSREMLRMRQQGHDDAGILMANKEEENSALLLGIDRNDPILAWGLLHQAAGVGEGGRK